jgi:eukaryotic-like serine/threonine-protein kinase
MTLNAGAKLGRYEIRSPIGAGGMGEVYRARDPKLGRDVAIEVLPASLSENADRLNRLKQEAQAAGALNHPNILSIYHIATHQGAPYIVSELLEGERCANAWPEARCRNAKRLTMRYRSRAASQRRTTKVSSHRDIKPDKRLHH